MFIYRCFCYTTIAWYVIIFKKKNNMLTQIGVVTFFRLDVRPDYDII